MKNIFFLSMNPMYSVALATLAMASIAQGTIILGTAATGTAVTFGTASTLSLGGTLGVLTLGAGIILKGLVIGAALRRGKRSADLSNEDAAFTVLTQSEPAQCYRRLICDMAAGAVPDQDKILSLFNSEVSVASPKFEYATAAKVGKIVKKAGLCELRYSCPLSSQEIAKLFN